MVRTTEALLDSHEAPACSVVNETGSSPFLLTCEHASNKLPERLGGLGLEADDLARHIAWDIGAEEVARAMSVILDAPLYVQGYSRLVCDCNRHPSARDFITTLSELTEIPGNKDLSAEDVELRLAEVHRPFHDTISAAIDARLAEERQTIVVSVHSFTPVFKGEQRPWNVGVLYNRDRHLAPRTLEILREQRGLSVGDNEPYAMSDETDYTIPVHSEQRGLPGVEFEVRNDQIRDPRGQGEWAERLCEVLRASARQLP